MKAVIGRLFRRFDGEEHKRDIEEEFRFHLDELTQKHLQQDMPLAEANDAALKRFGDVEQIKDECLEISSRRHSLMPVVKFLLFVMFAVGVLVRVNSTHLNVSRFGDLLMFVSFLCRLFLYVRGLSPSRFLSEHTTKSPLMLNDTAQLPFTIYDHRKLTPVERVISDK